MKRCPQCRRDYYDDTLLYCLDDGNALLEGPASGNEPATAILPNFESPFEPATAVFRPDAQAMTVSMSGYRPNSIAVLPFAHLSKDEDDEYFCDGLAEELINALSRVEDLKVVARTSAFSFKGKNIDIATIGSILNVNNVIEGSVRKFGDRMRINVQLISTADGYNVWSNKYDTEMRDLFDVQDEITVSVVNALKIKLLGRPKEEVQMAALIEELKQHAHDVEAYQLYLRGRFFLNKFTLDDYYRALDCFQKAVDLDPDYAVGYAGIADVHIWLTELGPVPPLEGMPRAREAALRAIALDPKLSEAHTSLALVLQEFDYDFARAESEYQLAITLNPNNAMAGLFYGGLLSQLRRFDEAESKFRRGLELDPRSVVNWLYPFGLFLARRYDDSIKHTLSILEIDQDVPAAVLVLSFNYQMKGDHRLSVDAYTRFLELCSLPEIAAIGRAAFENDGWEGFLRAMTAAERRPFITSYMTAVFYAALGEHESAIDELKESFIKREGHVVMLYADPRFDVVRDDPRFQALLEAIGFPGAS